MPINEFFRLDGMTKNVLESGEIVTHVHTPDDHSGGRATIRNYVKEKVGISRRPA